MGVHESAARVSARWRLPGRQSTAEESNESQQARPGVSVGAQAGAARIAAVHPTRRGGRGDFLRLWQSPRMAEHAGGGLLAAIDREAAVARGTEASSPLLAATAADAATLSARGRRNLAGRRHAESACRSPRSQGRRPRASAGRQSCPPRTVGVRCRRLRRESGRASGIRDGSDAEAA